MTALLAATVFTCLWLLFNVVDWLPAGRAQRRTTGVLLAVVFGTLYLNRGAFDAGFERIVTDISDEMVRRVQGIFEKSEAGQHVPAFTAIDR